MVFLLGQLEGFRNGVSLSDQFFLLVDEGIGIGKGVERLPWEFLLGNWFILKIRVLSEESVDEFCIKILFWWSSDGFESIVLESLRVLDLDEMAIFVVLGIDDTVFDEILESGFEMHSGPSSVVHFDCN